METEYTPKTDDELRRIALDYCDGKLFTDQQVPEGEDIFTPWPLLRLMTPEQLRSIADARKPYGGIGLIYSELKDAGPIAVNGLPSFFSFTIISQDEREKLVDYTNSELKRRAAFLHEKN